MNALTPETCVVRNTASRKGRSLAVAPGTTAARHLHYRRIILAAVDAPIRFPTGEQETGLIALKGRATVVAQGRTFNLGRYDALYVPRDAEVEVRPGDEGCDLAEVAAPVTGHYPLQFVAFAQVQKDPSLHFKARAPPTQPMLNILLGRNVEAG